MKKRILLVAMLMLLFVCVFAISVSADEILNWSEITHVDGMADKTTFGTDGTSYATSRVLMDDGKTYPSYYIFKNSTTMGFDFSELKTKSGISYDYANIVRIEIPNGITTLSTYLTKCTKLYEVVVPEGVEAIVKQFLNGNTTVTKVTLPSTIKSIGEQSFYKIGAVEQFVIPEGCTSIGRIAFKYSEIKSVVIPSTVVDMSTEVFIECKSLTDIVCKAPIISKQMFKSCTALENLTLEGTVEIGEQAFHSCGPVKSVNIPSTCTTINGYAFKNSKILSITVPSSVTTIGTEVAYGCTELKEINHHAQIAGTYMYRNCSAVETLEIDNLVTAETYSFYGLTSLKTIDLPNTLTTVGDFSFSKLGVETLVTPTSLVNVGKSAFYSSATLKTAVVLGSVMTDSMFASCSNLYDAVITSNLTTFSGNPFASCSQSSFTIYFLGNDYEAVRTLTKSNVRFSGPLCDYEEFNRADFGTKNVFVYNANLCEVVYGNHLEDNNPCVINCERCGVKGKAEENPIHKEITDLLYASYDKDGQAITSCGNNGCAYKTTKEAPALFTCLGYSSPEGDRGGIVIGFTINKEALNEYSEYLSKIGKTFKYGAFAVAKAKLGDKDIFGENGAVADYAVVAEISDYDFVAFDIKIVGFTDEHKSAPLALGTYAMTIDEDGNAEYSYMQYGKPNENEKYCFISYNDLANS